MSLKESLLDTLLALRNDPRASNERIAKVLEVSANTVKNRVVKLKEMGVLRQNTTYEDSILGTREQTEVVANYSPAAIGLFRLRIVFEEVLGNAAYLKLERMLDDHPYTYYRVRTYGVGGNLYVMVDLPRESIELFKTCIIAASVNVYCKKVSFIEPLYFVNTKDDLRQVNTDLRRWNYVVQDFVPERIELENPYDRQPESLDDIELKLLRELTINGKVSLTKIQADYSVDISTLSRRIKRLHETGVILRYTLAYNRAIFGLDSTYLFRGRIREIGLYVKSIREFPFLSNLSFDEEGNFSWMVYCPAKVATQVFAKLIELGEVRMDLVDNNKGMRYFFYPKNYTDNGWNIDLGYICPWVRAKV